MYRFLLGCFGSGICLASAAFAQTLSVEPGNWVWSATVNMSGIPISQEGTECVRPEEATQSLSELTTGLDDGCAVSDVEQTGNTTRFSVVCQGDIGLEADGRIDLLGQEVRLELEGALSLDGQTPTPVKASGKANRRGTC